MFDKKSCTRFTSLNVALLVENGIVLKRQSLRFSKGVLPLKRIDLLYGPDAL